MIVRTITSEKTGVTVRIADDALRQLSFAQIERNRREAQRVASRILDRAVARGAVEGLTPEEWRQRHGDGGTGRLIAGATGDGETDCHGLAGLAMTDEGGR